jgi:hypothetical protein
MLDPKCTIKPRIEPCKESVTLPLRQPSGVAAGCRWGAWGKASRLLCAAGLALAVALLSPDARAQDRELGDSPNDLSRPFPSNGNYEFDFDDPPPTDHELAPYWYWGADIEIDIGYEGNYDLDDDEDDDLGEIQGELEFALAYIPSDNFEIFLDLALSKADAFVEEGDDKDRPTKLKLKQANFTVRNIFDTVSAKVGRQTFDDEREWLYDEELDGIRLYSSNGSIGFETSISQQGLVSEDLLNSKDRDRITNYELRGSALLGEESFVSAYVFYRDDLESEPEDLLFFGIHSSGELDKDFDYWLDAALVRGDDDSTDIHGYGIDLGATYVFDLPLEPSLTLAAALGSGDSDPDDGTDRSFRQSGLQGNSAKFNGVTSFDYYGEVFQPELSNMAILTLGGGLRPTKRSSLDLVYHHYRQQELSDELRDVGIEADPSGESRDLGHGIDVILGYKGIENVDLEAVLGGFIPGNAFSEADDNAFFAGAQIEYEF